MIFEEFNPKIHNVHQVADFIFEIDLRVLKKLFSSKQEAVSAIEDKLLVKYPHVDDYSKFYVIYKKEDPSKILAILLISKGKNHNYFNDSIFLFKKLKFMHAFHFSEQNIIDKFTLSNIDNSDFYIAEIATNNAERCQGVGRAVVNYAIDQAKKQGFRRVVIDVDFKNSIARKLYESLGFKVYDTKSFKFAGYEKKMYNMEYVI
ncbi:hypothetical protein BGI41_07900 [Methanobrevibacter sp. 87.7]|uniref:GNAT family N-acetyltransferase n=1 Tax=Methanobrevibacter sp. 87.7 TaxID=387957 RepID=UPI000B50DFDB|nr:GNAT family N-acetyltransferase [Methanobrevibacter sp. 87.7]OWT32391.1 hypothetical protein BGI41_07900 [Methanobrevibacter sp. 87.7]